MFGAEARLSRARFMDVFRTGKRGHSPFFVLVYAKSPQGRDVEAAAVVSKKVARSAVARNKLRRRLYHALRKTLVDGGYGGSYIILAKPAAVTASYPELVEALAHSIAHLLGGRDRTR